MKNLLDIYLQQKNLTRYQLSKISGINQTTWKSLNDNRKGVDAFTGKHIKALAKVLGVSAGQVLEELIALERKQVCTS